MADGQVTASGSIRVAAVSSYEASLQALVNPFTDTGHVVRYRYRKGEAGGEQVDLVVQLRQAGTVIAAWEHVDVGAAVTGVAQTLTAGQAGSITDYEALALRFVFRRHGDGDARQGRITWAEMEAPEATIAVISAGDVGDDRTQEIDVDSSGPEADHHDLERSPAGEDAWTVIADDLTLEDGDTLTDDAFTPDTTSDYRLVSYELADESDGGTPSNVVTVTHPPARPRHLKAGFNRCVEARMDVDGGSGVVAGFSTHDTTAGGAAFTVDAAEGAQKISVSSEDGAAVAGVAYDAGSVTPGDRWRTYVGHRFANLETGVTGSVRHIYLDSEGAVVLDAGFGLTNEEWDHKWFGTKVPDGAASLTVRLQLDLDGDAVSVSGDAWFRDLQIVGPDQFTSTSIKATGLDEADDVGEVHWYIRPLPDGTFALEATPVNASGDQNVEHEFLDLDPGSYEVTATAVRDGEESGQATPFTVDMPRLEPADVTLPLDLESSHLSGKLRPQDVTLATTLEAVSVSAEPVAVVTTADTQFLLDPAFSLDARVGGEAEPFERASDKWTRRGSGGGGGLYVHRRQDVVGKSKYGVETVIAERLMLDLESGSAPLHPDSGRFSSASAWTRNGVTAEAAVRSVFLEPPPDVESRRLESGTGDDARLEQVVGTYDAAGEVVLTGIFERVDGDVVRLDLYDDTADAVVAALSWDFTTEAAALTGANATARTEVLSDVGPNGGQVVRLDLTLDQGAEGIGGNARRIRAWGSAPGSGTVVNAIWHLVQLEDQGWGSSPMPQAGAPEERDSELADFEIRPAPPVEGMLWYFTFVPLGQDPTTVPYVLIGSREDDNRLEFRTRRGGLCSALYENGVDGAFSTSANLSGYADLRFVEAAVHLRADGAVRFFGRTDRGAASASNFVGPPDNGIRQLRTSRIVFAPGPEGRRDLTSRVKAVRASGIGAALDGTADDAVLDELALVETGPLG